MKEKTMSVTDFKKKMFGYLDEVYLKGAVFTLEKGGIPLAQVIPMDKNQKTRKTLAQVLKETQGILADIPGFEEDQKELEKRALEEAEEMRNQW